MWLDEQVYACIMAPDQKNSPGSGTCVLPFADLQLNPMTRIIKSLQTYYWALYIYDYYFYCSYNNTAYKKGLYRNLHIYGWVYCCPLPQDNVTEKLSEILIIVNKRDGFRKGPCNKAIVLSTSNSCGPLVPVWYGNRKKLTNEHIVYACNTTNRPCAL